MRRMTVFLITMALLWSGAGAARGETRPATPSAHCGNTSNLLNFAMLLAEDEPAAKDGEDLSPPVAKAIADVRTLLPFKHYRLVDSALVRSTNAAPGQIELSGAGGPYHTSFLYRCSDDGNRLDFAQFELHRSHPAPSPAGGSGDSTPSPDRSLIKTSFSIDVGETIVVGTSSLVSNYPKSALIVVLTALPSH